jgi:uncharacterized membrane protein
MKTVELARIKIGHANAKALGTVETCLYVREKCIRGVNKCFDLSMKRAKTKGSDLTKRSWHQQLAVRPVTEICHSK